MTAFLEGGVLISGVWLTEVIKYLLPLILASVIVLVIVTYYLPVVSKFVQYFMGM